MSAVAFGFSSASNPRHPANDQHWRATPAESWLGIALLLALAAPTWAEEGGANCPANPQQRNGAEAKAAKAASTRLASRSSAQKVESRLLRKSRFPALSAGTTLADDRTLDTRVTWARSVKEAVEKADSEGKLVFMIHVSGDFEQPEFT
jgi:hypothetical protein